MFAELFLELAHQKSRLPLKHDKTPIPIHFMKYKKSPLLFLVTLGLSAPALYAQTIYWDGVDSASWATPGNWSTAAGATTPNPAAAPGAANDVVFHISTVNATRTMIFGNGYNPAAKSITFRSTGTFTMNSNVSAASGNRTLTIGSGGISKTSNSGVVNINGNTANGATGTGVITVALASSSSQTWSNASTTTALNIGTTLLGTNAAAVVSLGANTLTLDGDGNFNFGISGAANNVVTGATGSLIKNGAGTLTINSRTNYGGTTTISGGKLTLAGTGSIANSPSIIVGASTTFDVSGVTGGYTLGASQTLSGSGTVTGAMIVSGTLSPGNSPGIMTTGSQTWANGADYNFQMLDATGTAGTGYDQIAITGTLNLSDLTAGGFGINIWSLSSTGPDVSGNALNFNNSIDQSWTILTTTEGITGFDAGDFLINVDAMNGTNGFSNALGGGVFSLSATPNNLILNYTAVPEPNAALLGSLSILALLRRRR